MFENFTKLEVGLIVHLIVNSLIPPTPTAGLPKLNHVMPNVNHKLDHKLDWLESSEEERRVIDSLVVTIDKWVKSVR